MRFLKWIKYRWEDRDDWKGRAMLDGYNAYEEWEARGKYPHVCDTFPDRTYQYCWQAWLLANHETPEERKEVVEILKQHLSKWWRTDETSTRVDSL